MSFRVGQKVVCVDAMEGLVNGATYSVTRIGSDCECQCISVGVMLRGWRLGEEYECARCGSHGRISTLENEFHVSRFRPLDALTEQVDRIETEGAPIEEPQPEFA